MLAQVHLINVYTDVDDFQAPFNDAPLPCRLTHNSLNYQMQTLPLRERYQAMAGRRLQYPATFDMPDNARIEWLNDPTSEGHSSYWNVLEETESAWQGVGGVVVVNTCQLERMSTRW